MTQNITPDAAHMQYASSVCAARLQAAVSCEVGIETAGAIDSTGTVIGAGLAEGLQGRSKGRPCRRGT